MLDSYLTYLEAKEKPQSEHLKNALHNLELARKREIGDHSEINSIINSTQFMMDKLLSLKR